MASGTPVAANTVAAADRNATSYLGSVAGIARALPAAAGGGVGAELLTGALAGLGTAAGVIAGVAIPNTGMVSTTSEQQGLQQFEASIAALTIAASRTSDGRFILYHGTSVEHAIPLLNGAPLSVTAATEFKFSKEKGLSPVGFYLTPDIGAAEMFAIRRPRPAVVQFAFTKAALQSVMAGSVFGEIPPGKLPRSPGLQLLVLPPAFPTFDFHRSNGGIIATPAE